MKQKVVREEGKGRSGGGVAAAADYDDNGKKQ